MKDRFRQLYREEPRLFQAPGRVNLIGEHTDYNQGFVMPAALTFSTRVAAAARADGKLAVFSFGEQVVFEELSRRGHWSDYVAGVAWALEQEGVAWSGASLLIEGDVPVGAGLSSSASVEVAVGLALLALAGEEWSGPRLAAACQRAENEFVGMRCGIMDQFIAACGRPDHALLLDCRDLSYRLLPLPAGVQLVIANSMVRHQLTGGDYNRRRAECEEGCRQLGLQSLRDATGVEGLEGVLLRRCRHVVSENRRVLEAGQALESGDLAAFGRLMSASHVSLRDDFEVSCPEVDRLVELATGQPGVYGSRMTGGGFGGCTLSLVEEAAVPALLEHLRQGYPEGEFYVATASAGGHELAGPP